MESPLVSIIIPCFNRAHLIGETLETVLSQTYKNWECIIVDDHSTDNTTQVVTTYAKQDARFKLVIRPDNRKKGASSCRNYGIELSQGELIQFLDSDDLLKSNKLEKQVRLYQDDLTLFTCQWGGFEKESDLISRFKYKYHSYRNFRKGINLLNTFGKKNEFFPPHVYLTPRKLIEKAGWWNEELSNNDDAEFFTRIILSAKRIKFTPEAAVYYRYSGSDKLSSFTSADRVRSAIKSWRLIESHIQRNHSNSSVLYVENAKKFLKEIFQKKYPEIMKEEHLFFTKKQPGSLSLKLKQTVSVLFRKNHT